VGERRDRDELMLRGSLFVKRRRCGKPNCRCVDGDLHESPALAVNVDGRSRTIVLGDADVEMVAAALARYRRAREALDAGADAGLAALDARLAARRERRS